MNRIDSVRIEGSLPSPVSCAVLRLLARAAFSLLMAVGSLCNSPNISTSLNRGLKVQSANFSLALKGAVVMLYSAQWWKTASLHS